MNKLEHYLAWAFRAYHDVILGVVAAVVLAFLIWLWALFGCDNDSR